MHWRCAPLLIAVIVPLLLVSRSATAAPRGLEHVAPASPGPRKRPETSAEPKTARGSGTPERAEGRRRTRRSPAEEMPVVVPGPSGPWHQDRDTGEGLRAAEELLERLRNGGPEVAVLEELLEEAAESGGSPSKSRNSRNRASHELEVLEKLVEMFSLKQNSPMKRGEGPQLSVVSPLDVLRQQLIYEMARRRQRERQDQIKANDELIKSMGKRSVDLKEQNAVWHEEIAAQRERIRTLAKVQRSGESVSSIVRRRR